MVYHIFCEKHTPLKLRRTLESQEKKMKEEIEKFFKFAEKYCTTMVSLNYQRQRQGSLTEQITLDQNTGYQRMRRKEDDPSYLNLIQKYKEIISQKNSSLSLESNHKGESENVFSIKDALESHMWINKDKMLAADDEVWGIMPYKNLTPEQKYNKYRKICAKLRHENKAKEHQRNIERDENSDDDDDYNIKEDRQKEKNRRNMKKNKEKQSKIKSSVS